MSSSLIQKAKVRVGTAVIDSMIKELQNCKLHLEAKDSEKKEDKQRSGKPATKKPRKHPLYSAPGHRNRKKHPGHEYLESGSADSDSSHLLAKKDGRSSPSITDPSISDPFGDDEPPSTDPFTDVAASNQPHRHHRRRKRIPCPPLGPPPKYDSKAGFITHLKACIAYERAARVKAQRQNERRERRKRREQKKKKEGARRDGIVYEKTGHGVEVEEREKEEANDIGRMNSLAAQVDGPVYVPKSTWSFPRQVKEGMERIDREIAKQE
jgi:hypothetical protein